MSAGCDPVRVLVTGGAGYIGSHCVRVLLRAGYTVTILDNLSTGHRFVLDRLPQAEAAIGDIRDAAFVAGVMRDFRPEAILHFAAKAYVGESVRDPLLYFDHNVAGTLCLLKAACAQGVKGVVFSSTCAVYGETGPQAVDEHHHTHPLSPYGISKRMVEQVLETLALAPEGAGLSSVILRYFNAAGASDDGLLGEVHLPETHLIPLALRASRSDGEALQIFGLDYATRDGTCERDYLHVEDLAEAHLLALRRLVAQGSRSGEGEHTRCEHFNLGVGHPYSVLEVVHAVERVTGRRVRWTGAPRRVGDPARVFANPALALTQLDWRAERGLDAIVRSAEAFEASAEALLRPA